MTPRQVPSVNRAPLGNTGTSILKSFGKTSTQRAVFLTLRGQKWVCRGCAGKKIGSEQYAGGGGIQGLKRGSGVRPGLKIQSQRQYCSTCKKPTRQDRWTGKYQQSIAASPISKPLRLRILRLLKFTDTLEQRKRHARELVIDHRFPMNRWGGREPKLNMKMSDVELLSRFQLLKKDSFGNHNSLKSRACEQCKKTDLRGTPMGIHFWYEGDRHWPQGIPRTGRRAEQGCVGCGWYAMETWRERLNTVAATP